MDKARSTRFEDHFTIALCKDVLKMEASDDRVPALSEIAAYGALIPVAA